MQLTSTDLNQEDADALEVEQQLDYEEQQAFMQQQAADGAFSTVSRVNRKRTRLVMEHHDTPWS